LPGARAVTTEESPQRAARRGQAAARVELADRDLGRHRGKEVRGGGRIGPAPEDEVFPIAHAERYAAALSDAELVTIDDSFSFTPEDRPDAVAAAIRRFVSP
jgi:pimeloyl-ACP methyl ester carboxylesterase